MDEQIKMSLSGPKKKSPEPPKKPIRPKPLLKKTDTKDDSQKGKFMHSPSGSCLPIAGHVRNMAQRFSGQPRGGPKAKTERPPKSPDTPRLSDSGEPSKPIETPPCTSERPPTPNSAANSVGCVTPSLSRQSKRLSPFRLTPTHQSDGSTKGSAKSTPRKHSCVDSRRFERKDSPGSHSVSSPCNSITNSPRNVSRGDSRRFERKVSPGSPSVSSPCNSIANITQKLSCVDSCRFKRKDSPGSHSVSSPCTSITNSPRKVSRVDSRRFERKDSPGSPSVSSPCNSITNSPRKGSRVDSRRFERKDSPGSHSVSSPCNSIASSLRMLPACTPSQEQVLRRTGINKNTRRLTMAIARRPSSGSGSPRDTDEGSSFSAREDFNNTTSSDGALGRCGDQDDNPCEAIVDISARPFIDGVVFPEIAEDTRHIVPRVTQPTCRIDDDEMPGHYVRNMRQIGESVELHPLRSPFDYDGSTAASNPIQSQIIIPSLVSSPYTDMLTSKEADVRIENGMRIITDGQGLMIIKDGPPQPRVEMPDLLVEPPRIHLDEDRMRAIMMSLEAEARQKIESHQQVQQLRNLNCDTDTTTDDDVAEMQRAYQEYYDILRAEIEAAKKKALEDKIKRKKRGLEKKKLKSARRRAKFDKINTDKTEECLPYLNGLFNVENHALRAGRSSSSNFGRGDYWEFRSTVDFSWNDRHQHGPGGDRLQKGPSSVTVRSQISGAGSKCGQRGSKASVAFSQRCGSQSSSGVCAALDVLSSGTSRHSMQMNDLAPRRIFRHHEMKTDVEDLNEVDRNLRSAGDGPQPNSSSALADNRTLICLVCVALTSLLFTVTGLSMGLFNIAELQRVVQNVLGREQAPPPSFLEQLLNFFRSFFN